MRSEAHVLLWFETDQSINADDVRAYLYGHPTEVRPCGFAILSGPTVRSTQATSPAFPVLRR